MQGPKPKVRHEPSATCGLLTLTAIRRDDTVPGGQLELAKLTRANGTGTGTDDLTIQLCAFRLANAEDAKTWMRVIEAVVAAKMNVALYIASKRNVTSQLKLFTTTKRVLVQFDLSRSTVGYAVEFCPTHPYDIVEVYQRSGVSLRRDSLLGLYHQRELLERLYKETSIWWGVNQAIGRVPPPRGCRVLVLQPDGALASAIARLTFNNGTDNGTDGHIPLLTELEWEAIEELHHAPPTPPGHYWRRRPTRINVFVNVLGTTRTAVVGGRVKASRIMRLINQWTKLTPSTYTLSFGGHVFRAHQRLVDFGVVEGSTLVCNGTIIGGFGGSNAAKRNRHNMVKEAHTSPRMNDGGRNKKKKNKKQNTPTPSVFIPPAAYVPQTPPSGQSGTWAKLTSLREYKLAEVRFYEPKLEDQPKQIAKLGQQLWSASSRPSTIKVGERDRVVTTIPFTTKMWSTTDGTINMSRQTIYLSAGTVVRLLRPLKDGKTLVVYRKFTGIIPSHVHLYDDCYIVNRSDVVTNEGASEEKSDALAPVRPGGILVSRELHSEWQERLMDIVEAVHAKAIKCLEATERVPLCRINALRKLAKAFDKHSAVKPGTYATRQLLVSALTKCVAAAKARKVPCDPDISLKVRTNAKLFAARSKVPWSTLKLYDERYPYYSAAASFINPLSEDDSLAYRIGMRSYTVVKVRTLVFRELLRLGHGRRSSLDVARELRYACARTIDTTGIPEPEKVYIEQVYPQLCMQHYRMLEEADKTRYPSPTGIAAGVLNSMAQLCCLLGFFAFTMMTYMYRVISSSTDFSSRSMLSRSERLKQAYLRSTSSVEGLFNLSGVIILAAVITSGVTWQSIVSLLILSALQCFEYSTIRLGLLLIIAVSQLWPVILGFSLICVRFVITYVPTHLGNIGLILTSLMLLRIILRSSSDYARSKSSMTSVVLRV